ncbi:MAG TPA: hypothetical protein ENL09_03885, partial [Bacteroidetes bacterium]|nr:hypothetical protein [Bacteroidota bacterium]
MDTNKAKEVAIECALEAGKLLTDNFEKIKKVSFKAVGDIVTNVDDESEELIIKKIKANFPDHSILSEEAGMEDNSSEYLWLLDPLDGTATYSCGNSPFRVIIALLHKGEPIISAIYNPVKDDLYLAVKGEGATLNGKKITVTDNSELRNFLLLVHLSSKEDARLRVLKILNDLIKN